MRSRRLCTYLEPWPALAGSLCYLYSGPDMLLGRELEKLKPKEPLPLPTPEPQPSAYSWDLSGDSSARKNLPVNDLHEE